MPSTTTEMPSRRRRLMELQKLVEKAEQGSLSSIPAASPAPFIAAASPAPFLYAMAPSGEPVSLAERKEGKEAEIAATPNIAPSVYEGKKR